MPFKKPAPSQNLLKRLLFFYQNKKYINAENLALSITKKYPTHNYAWKILAGVLEQTKRIPEALKINQRALEIDPHDPEIYLCLGNNFHQLGKLDYAELNYKKAIDLKPNYLQAYNNLGLILKKLNRLEEASSCFKQVIHLKPDFAIGYNSLSTVLIDLEDFESAIVNLKKAIHLKPNYQDAFFNFGIALRNLGLKDKATLKFKKAIALKSDYLKAHDVLGITLIELGKYEEAVKSFQQTIKIDPSYAEGYNNLGLAFTGLRRLDDATNNFKKAIELKTNYADAYNNFGRLLMLNQNFKTSFELQEWRLKRDELNFIPLNTTKPRWSGSNNQKVFVWKEQGIGDFIMFSSMIPELNNKVEKVIIECDERLVPIFKRSFCNNIKYITDRAELDDLDYDSQIPIGSLALHFRKNLINFRQTSKGWLKADTEKNKDIIQRITQNKSKKIVGLSWKTFSLIPSAHLRNIDLYALLKPLEKLDVVFINLQYGDVSNEISNLRLKYGIEIIDLEGIDLFKDLDDLLALISTCDCVITIDNLIAHFSGALGIKTKLLLPAVADERWGLDQSKCYLYDSIEFYRQSVYGNWTKSIESIKLDLQNQFSN